MAGFDHMSICTTRPMHDASDAPAWFRQLHTEANPCQSSLFSSRLTMFTTCILPSNECDSDSEPDSDQCSHWSLVDEVSITSSGSNCDFVIISPENTIQHSRIAATSVVSENADIVHDRKVIVRNLLDFLDCLAGHILDFESGLNVPATRQPGWFLAAEVPRPEVHAEAQQFSIYDSDDETAVAVSASLARSSEQHQCASSHDSLWPWPVFTTSNLAAFFKDWELGEYRKIGLFAPRLVVKQCFKFEGTQYFSVHFHAIEVICSAPGVEDPLDLVNCPTTETLTPWRISRRLDCHVSLGSFTMKPSSIDAAIMATKQYIPDSTGFQFICSPSTHDDDKHCRYYAYISPASLASFDCLQDARQTIASFSTHCAENARTKLHVSIYGDWREMK